MKVLKLISSNSASKIWYKVLKCFINRFNFLFSCSVVDVEETCGPFETNACNHLRLPNGPFAVCLAKLGSDATGYYNSCVIDSCAYKNKPKLRETILCQAFETLARKCEEIGIYADWRSPTKCRKF